MNEYQLYLDAEYRINEGLIRLDRFVGPPLEIIARPEKKMEEMASFLNACKNPQAGIPAIHVAGTSGKGSVSACAAGLLRSAGLSVGLHVSPYLQSATEKIWIDGQYVSGKEFHDLVNWVLPIATPRLRPETPASIHGMASVAIALEAFRRHQTDVIVMEAGCGARFDLTAFVDTRVGVVTNVGLDHVHSLGPDIENIAWHKAGVARLGMPLITGASGAPLEIIREEANKLGCPLTEIPEPPDRLAHNRQIAREAASRMLTHLGMKPLDFNMDETSSTVRLPGRCEQMPGDGPVVFLDGAHNRDKLTVAIQRSEAVHVSGPRILVLGLLGAKATEELLGSFKSSFDGVIVTEPKVYGKSSCPAAETARLLSRIGIQAEVEPDPTLALEKGLARAGADGLLLVTGSFYLTGALRDRWFPKQAVVEARTSWPNIL